MGSANPAASLVFAFEITAHCPNTRARCGCFHTPHGVVNTPRFMPVGTLATVKGVTPAQLKATGAEMVLSNTFHLHLQPGEQIVADGGGLHRFMAWDGPMLTDSGGFQVFSLGDINTINDRGVVFRSPRDGARIDLTPERSMAIQMTLGADVAMAFDQCPPYPASESEVAAACRRTHAWLERCISSHTKSDQALFGIVQGGTDLELRRASAEAICSHDLPGYAIGGVSVGEGHEMMCAVTSWTAPLLPEDRPRYLMGVGTPEDILEAVARGVDMFDCVMPTRSGRHGQAFTSFGRLNLRNAKHAEDLRPLDASIDHPALNSYSRAYLHHLVRSGEILGMMLMSWANIAYYQHLMQGIRDAVEEGSFEAFRQQTKARWAAGEISSES